MPFVLRTDPVFKEICSISAKRSRSDESGLVKLIGLFKKGLSLEWLVKFASEDAIESLALVMNTLLVLTEDTSSSFRIASNSALGALLLAVVPFQPRLFIKAFGAAIASVQPAPHVSIAIINMFIALSKYVKDSLIQEFIITVPALPHFKISHDQHLQFLTQSIAEMGKLPPVFHDTLLDSLLGTFDQSPTSQVVTALMSLLRLNPAQMIPKIFGTARLESRIFLAPWLLEDDTFFVYLSDSQVQEFYDYALRLLQMDKCEFTLFEAACLVIDRYIKRLPAEERVRSRASMLQLIRSDYPTHYKRLLLLLPLDLDQIVSLSDQTDSFIGVQLNAITNYFLQHPTPDAADQIAATFLTFTNAQNDLFCTLLECLTRTIDLLIKLTSTPDLLILIRSLFQRPSRNWVQDTAAAHLIESIDFFAIEPKFPNYFDISTAKLFEFLFSKTDKFARTAIKAIRSIASYSNISKLCDLVLHLNWISEHDTTRSFQLLSELILDFPAPHFWPFLGIAFESMSILDGLQFGSAVCLFLSHCRLQSLPAKAEFFCLRFLLENYESYTNVPFTFPGDERPFAMPDYQYLGFYDTDVISNPHFNHKVIVQPLANCMKLVCSLNPAKLKYGRKFFHLAIAYTPLLDDLALELASRIDSVFHLDSERVHKLRIKTFLMTADEDVIIGCLTGFLSSPLPLPKHVAQAIEKYQLAEVGAKPEILLTSFMILDQVDHERALTLLEVVASGPALKGRPSAVFKIAQVFGQRLISFVCPDDTIGLIQLANIGISDVAESIRGYMRTHSFSEWPVEGTLGQEIAIFLSHEPATPLGNLEALDRPHWEFAIQHSCLFDFSETVDFIACHMRLFAKIDISSIIPPQKQAFEISDLDMEPSDRFMTLSEIERNLTSEERVKEYISGRPDSVIRLLQPHITQHLIPLVSLLDPKVLPFYLIAANTRLAYHTHPVLHAIEQQLACTLHYSEIISSHNYAVVQAIAICDPAFFDPVFDAPSQISGKTASFLIRVYAQSNIDPGKVMVLVTQYLTLFTFNISTRKRILVLRLTTAVMSAFKTKQLTSELEHLAMLVVAIFDEISSTISDVHIPEVSHVLTLLARTVGARATEAIKTQLSVPSFFVEAASIAAIAHGESIDEQLFSSCFIEGTPSAKARAIRAIRWLTSPHSNSAAVVTVRLVLKSLYTNIKGIRYSPLLSVEFAQLMDTLLMHSAVYGLTPEFINAYFDEFLSNLSLPHTACGLLFSKPLIQRIPDFQRIFSGQRFCADYLVRSLFDCAKTLVDATQSKELFSSIYFTLSETNDPRLIEPACFALSRLCDVKTPLLKVKQHFMRDESVNLSDLVILRKNRSKLAESGRTDAEEGTPKAHALQLVLAPDTLDVTELRRVLQT